MVIDAILKIIFTKIKIIDMALYFHTFNKKKDARIKSREYVNDRKV